MPAYASHESSQQQTKPMWYLFGCFNCIHAHTFFRDKVYTYLNMKVKGLRYINADTDLCMHMQVTSSTIVAKTCHSMFWELWQRYQRCCRILFPYVLPACLTCRFVADSQWMVAVKEASMSGFGVLPALEPMKVSCSEFEKRQFQAAKMFYFKRHGAGVRESDSLLKLRKTSCEYSYM